MILIVYLLYDVDHFYFMEDNSMQLIDKFDGKYDFLSNFYEREFTMDGITYKTAEHAFQSVKAKDAKEAQKVREAATPGKAKRLGRKVTLIDHWNELRVDYMTDIIRSKFGSDLEMQRKLRDTEDAILIEGNYWHDNFWGSCSCEKCRDIPGQNHLGEILMSVRKDLIQLNP